MLNADWVRACQIMLTAAALTARDFNSDSMTANVTSLERMHGEEHGPQKILGKLGTSFERACHLRSLKRRLISMSTMRPGEKVGPNQVSQKLGVTTT